MVRRPQHCRTAAAAGTFPKAAAAPAVDITALRLVMWRLVLAARNRVFTVECMDTGVVGHLVGVVGTATAVYLVRVCLHVVFTPK